jgi:hypothetical protein
LPNSLADGRPFDEVARQHSVDLVLGARALTNQLRTPRDPPSLRTRAFVRQPHHVELPAASSRASVLASRVSVLAFAWLI